MKKNASNVVTALEFIRHLFKYHGLLNNKLPLPSYPLSTNFTTACSSLYNAQAFFSLLHINIEEIF
jgi:hypothetical protein